MSGRGAVAIASRASILLAVLALASCSMAGPAAAERVQSGPLIASLDGRLFPRALPRERPAPVAVWLKGGLSRADRKPLPRVAKVELGLPRSGVLTTEGLPTCPRRLLQNALPAEALGACGPALVGRGRISAQVVLPNQKPFRIRAHVLAFNARSRGRKAVLFHAFTGSPPTVVVIPFVIERRPGGFGTVLVAHLSANLGPWPRFAQFSIKFSRRFAHHGRSRSYLSASCPIPSPFTGGLAFFAKATYTLASGKQISLAILRGCQVR